MDDFFETPFSDASSETRGRFFETSLARRDRDVEDFFGSGSVSVRDVVLEDGLLIDSRTRSNLRFLLSIEYIVTLDKRRDHDEYTPSKGTRNTARQ